MKIVVAIVTHFFSLFRSPCLDDDNDDDDDMFLSSSSLCQHLANGDERAKEEKPTRERERAKKVTDDGK